MLAQAPSLPPTLQKLATSSVLRSETPAGFRAVKPVRLAPNKQLHTLGAVRIDFKNSHATESEGYALLRTHTAAVRLARKEASVRTGGLFHVRAVATRRFAIAVTAKTMNGARALLALAVAHLRRVEGWRS